MSALEGNTSGAIVLSGYNPTAIKESKAVTGTPGERDLDRAVAEINNLKRDVFLNYWRLGRKFEELFTSQIWKQRKNPDGSPRYKGFKDFCAAEIQVSAPVVYRWVKIAQQFTEEVAVKLGHEKALMVLQAPAAVREKVQELAETSTKRELKQQIREMGIKPEKHAKPPRPTAENLTVVMEGKKQKVMLVERAKVKGEYPPAKSADKSWAKLKMKNDVVLVFGISRGEDKRWYLTVEGQRIPA